MPTKTTYYLFIISVLFLNACGTPRAESLAATILPAACQVQIGQQLALTLDGQIPANTQLQWSATMGEVVWTGQGLTAIFVAPDTPGDAIISVSFVSGTPTPITASRDCVVTSSQALVNPVSLVNPSAAVYTIAISELMGNPCGDMDAKKYNQYVELYNYGDLPVDVGGWWLFDEGQKGTPDRLVAWSSRSTFNLNSSSIINTTVIPPHGFAVILSPVYAESDIEQRMPYQFPASTILLTAGTSQTLGDDFFGIISSEDGYDTLTLYIGSETVIDQVVDTYGTPRISGPYVVNIDDDHLDHTPLYLSECESAERINPQLPDSESNWVTVRGGTPGDGPYR
jgi:hypothetical protein